MKVRDKATGAISTLVSLIKHPLGKTPPPPIRFDSHTMATTGPQAKQCDICGWDFEQAADNYGSAMADQTREIIYLAERRR